MDKLWDKLFTFSITFRDLVNNQKKQAGINVIDALRGPSSRKPPLPPAPAPPPPKEGILDKAPANNETTPAPPAPANPPQERVSDEATANDEGDTRQDHNASEPTSPVAGA